MTTKPLMRFIMDEVEKANLHATIWETVQSANSRYKCNGCITAVKRKIAEKPRKVGGIITGAKRKSAKSRRNLPAGVHKEPTCGRRF